MKEPAARAADSGAGPRLGPILAAGGAGLPARLEQTERRLAAIASSHGEVLGAHAGGTLAAGGKRIRPLLVFLSAGDSGAGHPDAGDSGPDGLLAAAAAVELLHMATLVHDDVLDRAELRRGHPTVFVTGGRTLATATGDLLFSRAFAELAATGSADAVRALSEASSALARGELMQRADAWSAPSAERYLERCRLKTARLFEAACRLGALLGSPGGAGAAELGRFGDCIGLAFQILDDVLDVEGPVERTGKQRGADLLDGTVTLPLIIARERDPGLAELDLRRVADARAAERVCERVAATGALLEARRQALGYVEVAKRTLGAAPLSEPQRTALALVADGVVDRYS